MDDEPIEGRVVPPGSAAQQVTREGDTIRIRLSLAPGTRLGPGMVTIPLAEPVRVEAGGRVEFEIDHIPAASQPAPLFLRYETTLNAAIMPGIVMEIP